MQTRESSFLWKNSQAEIISVVDGGDKSWSAKNKLKKFNNKNIKRECTNVEAGRTVWSMNTWALWITRPRLECSDSIYLFICEVCERCHTTFYKVLAKLQFSDMVLVGSSSAQWQRISGLRLFGVGYVFTLWIFLFFVIFFLNEYIQVFDLFSQRHIKRLKK